VIKIGRKTNGGKSKQLTDFSHLLEKDDKDTKDKIVDDTKEPV
jgi:hypothetical protein